MNILIVLGCTSLIYLPGCLAQIVVDADAYATRSYGASLVMKATYQNGINFVVVEWFYQDGTSNTRMARLDIGGTTSDDTVTDDNFEKRTEFSVSYDGNDRIMTLTFNEVTTGDTGKNVTVISSRTGKILYSETIPLDVKACEGIGNATSKTSYGECIYDHYNCTSLFECSGGKMGEFNSTCLANATYDALAINNCEDVTTAVTFSTLPEVSTATSGVENTATGGYTTKPSSTKSASDVPGVTAEPSTTDDGSNVTGLSAGFIAGTVIACVGVVLAVGILLTHFVFCKGNDVEKLVIGLYVAGAIFWVVGVILCFATGEGTYPMSTGQKVGTAFGAIGIVAGVAGLVVFLVKSGGYTKGKAGDGS